MFDIISAILIAGLTMGALYALATIGLSLVWGSMGMLNMAHAAMLTLGGYAAFTFSSALGLPVFVGFAGAILVGAVAGGLLYFLIVRNLLKGDKPTFESSVMSPRTARSPAQRRWSIWWMRCSISKASAAIISACCGR